MSKDVPAAILDGIKIKVIAGETHGTILHFSFPDLWYSDNVLNAVLN